MKRSEINSIIRDAREFFRKYQFHIPPWAYWSPEEWKGKYQICSEIVDHGLGWDITDFGSGNFKKRGLLLFTIRNGSIHKDDKKYCEKVMIVREKQVVPMHFHWSKTEDIINRGGGNLIIELYMAYKNEQLSDKPFTASVDGIVRTFEPGYKLVLTPGESITLPPFLGHRFYGETGTGDVLVGEVISVNDDKTDNRFMEEIGRFPTINEDEKPLHLLVSDYSNYI
jgi:D-lyxose ketol-isomerase